MINRCLYVAYIKHYAFYWTAAIIAQLEIRWSNVFTRSFIMNVLQASASKKSSPKHSHLFYKWESINGFDFIHRFVPGLTSPPGLEISILQVKWSQIAICLTNSHMQETCLLLAVKIPGNIPKAYASEGIASTCNVWYLFYSLLGSAIWVPAPHAAGIWIRHAPHDDLCGWLRLDIYKCQIPSVHYGETRQLCVTARTYHVDHIWSHYMPSSIIK